MRETGAVRGRKTTISSTNNGRKVRDIEAVALMGKVNRLLLCDLYTEYQATCSLFVRSRDFT